jgi:purine catabolism regulator
VDASDLPAPWEWAGSGELLLTNGTGLSPAESVQVGYIERLADTGASGLGLGLGMSGPPLSGQVTRRAHDLLTGRHLS